MGNNWASSYRTSRTIFVALALSLLLIWAITLKNKNDSRVFIETNRLIATISDISTSEIDSRYGGKSITYFATLDLPDGKKIRFILQRPPPKMGTQVPISVDIYDDGSRYYHYNQIDWKLLE